ncbi:MAG: serine/threonine-protein kinase, partial [Betaproteobacteria bacterium]
MPLAAGTHLGPCEIITELGAGGMGEVYRARDTKLGREVALKILPPAFVGDPERLARFEREAKTLAALNHPHIAQIYGLEESRGIRFLVMELVDGETLAARIAKGPLPIDEALAWAGQIAEALEAAHEKGIVHRDLKPANIMLTTEGVPKVLDFGLARQSEATASSTAISPDSPTLTSPAVHSPTIPGAIMGTAGYMSPEQARGRQVDKRSDIFSFGCVLYELLTGAKPFAGDTIADVLGATLHKDLDLSLLPAATPPNVRRVLARCLAKDKRQRLHDIADARIELQTPEPAAIEQPDPGRRSLIPLVVGAVLLAAAGAGAAWLAKPGAAAPAARPPAPPPVVHDAEILLPAGPRRGPAFQPGVAISDDGTMIVFPVNPEPPIDADSGIDRAGWAASTGLMLRRLDSPALTPVVGTEPESF